MLDFSKAIRIQKTKGRNSIGHYSAHDVRISINKRKSASEQIRISFFGRQLVSEFRNHNLTPYILDGKIAFVKNDIDGYKFNENHNRHVNDNNGYLRIANETLVRNIKKYVNLDKASCAEFDIKYDKETHVYYIDLRNSFTGGE